jgi:glycerophosphoryl diester phosphodiesterase
MESVLKRARLLLCLYLATVQFICVSQGDHSPRKQAKGKTHLDWVMHQLQKPSTSQVLLVAHRGDWRNAPENSLQSLKNSIVKEFDIVEFDLSRTKDGHLIVMHDKTIDRTTTGKGKPEDYTLAELKQFKLIQPTGHPTVHLVPTLDEFLDVSKGKVMLCVDKGFAYIEQALEIIQRKKMSDQVIYNIPAITFDSLQSLHIKGLGNELFLNVLGFPTDIDQAKRIVMSYQKRGNVIMHPVFKSDTIPFVSWMKELKSNGINLWLNSLWPEQNANHDDDRAVEQNQQKETWGWLVSQGATIIQTDRPQELQTYLRQKRKLTNSENGL